MDDGSRIAAVSEVPTDSTMLVTLRRVETGETVEAILTRLGDGSVVAFKNQCQHWTDVQLDRGSGAAIRDGQVLCRKHGAAFQLESGYCDFGPCEGSTLATIGITIEDETVKLTDGDYEFVESGGMERDPDDLSSGGRIGF